ncbi:tail fiber protein H [Campylobacter hyointestinalis subsp. hyointestinalis]|uniref:Tail fiber protein H n=1 Tax=Campylobacter hyointestinalis subsp. hyointestinalis TaxID=91352 RepID=A0A0S4SND2_CAMHY|nr:phage tail protein [Campylobacter hyointestinalis]CUU87920.1 tail fiber protein H [Campylobacter hyointestinalis subsp. hyointestinalis]
MNEFYTLLTNYGIAKIVEARANKQTINLSHIAVGDAEIIPSESMSALKSEKHRLAINSIIQDENNPSYLIIEGVIPVSVGGFYINEVGIFDESGNLFAIGNLPKTYKPLLSEGSAKDLTLKITIEVANASEITLKVDNSVVLATRSWTESLIKKKEDKGVAKTLDDALKLEIAGNYLLKTGVATDSDKLDGLHGNEYHQRNSANPSKVTSVTGNIIDLSQGDNFTVSLNTAGMLTLTNPSVGQSGVLIVSSATNISGFSSNISFRIVPTGLNSTETFAYFVQSEDVIKMGRV